MDPNNDAECGTGRSDLTSAVDALAAIDDLIEHLSFMRPRDGVHLLSQLHSRVSNSQELYSGVEMNDFKTFSGVKVEIMTSRESSVFTKADTLLGVCD